ncbi:lipopolysaccharide kinase InaA family protein [Sulfurimonas sp.]|uniref:lipopolysaccharide kinase InaA family protein n=1 Tax=Sulfurimonas sp. TaxID=2022749 RepID=UPI003566A44E
MSYKLEYNKEFQNFKNILLDIKSIFSQNSGTIHLARNELKVIEIENIKTVVKAFRIPNFLNQFVYAYLRKSKAYKAFHNATKLHELQVSTPEAIGYIEFFKSGLLKESFFISKEFKYDFTIAHIRDDQPTYKEKVLQDFAEFSYDIHTKGVWHVDYSGGNILIRKEEDKYIFSLVDINRMKFRSITGYEGLENFNKLWFNEEDLTTIAKTYSKIAGLDENKAISEILMHDKKLKDKVLLKRKLKGK